MTSNPHSATCFSPSSGFHIYLEAWYPHTAEMKHFSMVVFMTLQSNYIIIIIDRHIFYMNLIMIEFKYSVTLLSRYDKNLKFLAVLLFPQH